jgi:hypothetical protein
LLNVITDFEKGNPDWELFPYEVIKDLPAVQWKLLNIKKLMKGNPDKHKKLVLDLGNVLF